MKTTAERWWAVANRLGQYRVFDDELDARCWASRIGYGARVWETNAAEAGVRACT